MKQIVKKCFVLRMNEVSFSIKNQIGFFNVSFFFYIRYKIKKADMFFT